MKNTKKNREIRKIKLSQISIPDFRARQSFSEEKMAELMESITKQGLIHPVIVKTIQGGYEIIAGDRRFLAHRNLKLKYIDAEVIECTPVEGELIKLSENLQRDDLSDIEEAAFLRKLFHITKKSEKEIAKLIGRSPSFVRQKMAILDYPDYLYNAVAQKYISFSSARELVRITDVQTLREYVSFAVNSGITPAIAKKWADEWCLREDFQAVTEKQDDALAELPTVEEPLFLCQICQQAKKAVETRLVRVCINTVTCAENIRKEVE